MNCRIGNGPVSWGVDYAAAPENPPWALVLDQIADAGYRWTELGPLGYLPVDPAVLQAELDARRLRLPAGFIFDAFHDRAERSRLADATHAAASLIAAVGGTHLVLIDHPVRERTSVAGRPELARRLPAGDVSALLTTLAESAKLAREQHGLRAVVHHHAGTYIEYPDEIERVLDAIDDRLLGLCIDTGHCAYAGIDPVDLYRRYAARIDYLHLKDVDAGVRDRAISAGLDFDTAVNAGIFCPLGAGLVDFEQLAAALDATGFDGWATVEQDIGPSEAEDALGYARRSLRFLTQTGLHDVAQPRA